VNAIQTIKELNHKKRSALELDLCSIILSHPALCLQPSFS